MQDKVAEGASPNLIGENPTPKKMSPQQAVAIMSEGFLKTMAFGEQWGVPADVLAEMCNIGMKHGLAKRIPGFNSKGIITVQFINPYIQPGEVVRVPPQDEPKQ
jgi:hypothetical protein